MCHLSPCEKTHGERDASAVASPRLRGEAGARSAPGEGPMTSADALAQLKQAAITNQNIFSALMDAVRVCSLGQITHALFEVGGQYRRSM